MFLDGPVNDPMVLLSGIVNVVVVVGWPMMGKSVVGVKYSVAVTVAVLIRSDSVIVANGMKGAVIAAYMKSEEVEGGDCETASVGGMSNSSRSAHTSGSSPCYIV